MKTRIGIIAGIALLVSLIAVAYFRSGLLNLPSVPGELIPYEAGLHDLELMKQMNAVIEGTMVAVNQNHAVDLATEGVRQLRMGNYEDGIKKLQDAVRSDPRDLVLGNTLRMEIMKLKRDWLAANAQKSEIALQLPEYLNDQPVKFFREFVKQMPRREPKLQLALALVDHMLLFPALEIKAPSSVEAVEILTEILQISQTKDKYYVPALYARGLNYLYRPFNLVWPEKIAAPPDAASKDISLAVAVGQKIGAGSNSLKAELSLTLGDAYAKEGKFSLARSWWQLANNMARDEKFRERVFQRLKWNDDEVRQHLEETLQKQMEDLDHPLSDLRFMWN